MIWLDKYQDLCDIGREWKLIPEKKTIDEWVEIAERLAKENGGILPSQTWLRRHDYGGLVSARRVHPRPFAHIKRENFCKTVEEHIADAEKLAKKHGGVLPNTAWLKRNGHGDLVSMIYKYSRPFAHIKRENLCKTVEEHIADAEKLARDHDGVLPNQIWLRGNGYGGLMGAIQRYPERFAHIKQKSLKGKTIEEHVSDAENLAKEHNGLPSQRWLNKNGYSGLAVAIYKHPERFVHIKRKKFFKTVEDHIVDAEKMERKHGGVLPSQKWLKENGHIGLAAMIYKYPEMFVRIKQEKFCKNKAA